MLNFLLLYSALLMVFLHTQANNSPPIALFGFSDLTYSDAKKQYGLPCANSSIPILGVSSLKYQNSKTKLTFSTEDTTQHGESITLKCDTQNGYYENTYAKTEYTITCKDGSWQGVSMCVRKCKFATSEFTKEYIVKGRNVSNQSTENQYEIKDFTSATFPSTDIPIQKIGSDYYLNVGETVRIYCPTTHPPFTSDSTLMKYMNPNTSSFVTTCLSGSTPTQNQWSVEMACYNGFKPCDNTEVTIKTGGEKICNDIGDCFDEFGGKKTDEKGKTIHGTRLKLDCNNPWYFKQDYISPTCNDGQWTKTEAYCKAAFCAADNEIYNATGKREWNVGNAIIESKKVYYGQNYEFKCINSNRVGQKNGKKFKCSFDNQDRITVQQIDTGDWFNRYCLNSSACTNGYSYPWLDDAEYNVYLQSVFTSEEVTKGGITQYHDVKCQRTKKTSLCSNAALTNTSKNYTAMSGRHDESNISGEKYDYWNCTGRYGNLSNIWNYGYKNDQGSFGEDDIYSYEQYNRRGINIKIVRGSNSKMSDSTYNTVN
jgi:hypothetical protein